MKNDLEYSSAGLAFKFWPPASSLAIKSMHSLPIVVLHGLLGSHKNFGRFAQSFSAAGHPVLCFDCRNHGASFHSDDFDYPLMAADLDGLLSDLERQRYGGLSWRRVVVLGHSMGGRTAMMHALLYPGRVAALISVDVVPSLENPDIGIAQVVEAMYRIEPQLASLGQRKEAEALLRRELKARGSDSEATLQFLLLCNLQSTGQQGVKDYSGYRWACNANSLRKHLQQVVCWPADWLEQYWHKQNPQTAAAVPVNLRLPLLLIAGGRSPYVQTEGWELLLRYFPHSKAAPTVQKVIESAYHWPHTQTPEEFGALVAEFLRSL